MESVGTQLRQARLTLGLTLEEVQRRTCISLKNLTAIESDELSRFGSPFFYKSFVKQIAKQLEIDYDLLAAAVQQAADTIPEPLVPGQVPPGSAVSDLGVNGGRERRPKNLQWLYSLLSFALMLIACSSFYGAWQQSRSSWRTQVGALLNLLMPPARNTGSGPVQQSVAPLAPPLTAPLTEPSPKEAASETRTDEPNLAPAETVSTIAEPLSHPSATRRHKSARSSHRLRRVHRGASSVPRD